MKIQTRGGDGRVHLYVFCEKTVNQILLHLASAAQIHKTISTNGACWKRNDSRRKEYNGETYHAKDGTLTVHKYRVCLIP